MGSEGWVVFHRKITEWEWFKFPNAFLVFGYLILKANHAEGKWHGNIIGRGQLITGRKKIALDCGVSEQSVRTILDKLISTNEITIKPTNKFSLISICNYEVYQFQSTSNITNTTTTSNQQLTNNQPTINQQSTTNNNNNTNNNEDNDKNEKNLKKKEANLKVLARLEKNKLKLSKLLEHEYFKNEEFSELWETFNLNKGDKATIDAKIMGLRKLFKFTVEESIEALENSIISKWPGLFPKKANALSTNGKKPFLLAHEKSQQSMESLLKDCKQAKEEGREYKPAGIWVSTPIVKIGVESNS